MSVSVPTPSPTEINVGVSVRSVAAGYGVKPVLDDVSFDAAAGEILGILGHNGAGKSTLLRTIFGLMRPSAGEVVLDPARARPGRMSLVPADRIVFAPLPVIDNLMLAVPHADKDEIDVRVEWAFGTFPILGTRQRQLAGSLSGGEQRMLALAMAIMRNPAVLMLDEPSLGLAPALVEEFLARVKDLADERKLTCLLVEQNVRQALKVVDRIIVLRDGRIAFHGTAAEFKAIGEGQWWQLF